MQAAGSTGKSIVRASSLWQGVETVRLQREASAHLNTMVDELRNSQNANLSAKNLGNEGTAYVVEGLAFNDRYAGRPSSMAACQAR